MSYRSKIFTKIFKNLIILIIKKEDLFLFKVYIKIMLEIIIIQNELKIDSGMILIELPETIRRLYESIWESSNNKIGKSDGFNPCSS